MFLTDGDGNISNQFTNGDPLIPTPATQVNADWLNMLQNELRNILTGASVSPNKADSTQVLASLRVIFGALASANTWTQIQTFGQLPVLPARNWQQITSYPVGFVPDGSRVPECNLRDGIVRLQGVISKGASSSAPETICTLPSPFWPSKSQWLTGHYEFSGIRATMALEISTIGAVILQTDTTYTSGVNIFSLDGLTFSINA